MEDKNIDVGISISKRACDGEWEEVDETERSFALALIEDDDIKLKIFNPLYQWVCHAFPKDHEVCIEVTFPARPDTGGE